ncbi:MAG TPA: GNAT family N-acetyltransferase [Acidimicrobiales bacterium]|nr:GNAT family N-acetyltransferase [Acidimicrobiales bacterium]
MSYAPSPAPLPRPGPGHRTPLAEVLVGASVLDDLGDDLDRLHAGTGVPVTVRRPWLETWARAHPERRACAVVVRDPASRRLDGAALFGTADDGATVDISPLGHGRNDRSRLPVRTPAAAHRLAHALVEWLTGLDRPWTLRLEQLPEADPVAVELARLLPTVHLVRAAPIPLVRFHDDASPCVEQYLGKGMRKQLRRAYRRLEQDRVAVEIGVAGDCQSVFRLLDDVERIHRQRDHDVRGRSDLDAPGAARFWREVIERHAWRGEVEISTLRLNGTVAAYVVALIDGHSYRVLDGRFATEWSDASPGRLLETATLERAVRGPEWTELDWMNSVASEKLVAYNCFEQTQHLVGCSPRQVRGPVVLTEEVEGRPTADLALAALTAGS